MPKSDRGLALVVGGSGFVGSNITRALLEAGWQVAVFGPPGPPGLLDDLEGRFEPWNGNITNAEEVRAATSHLRPDAIVVAAGHNIGGAGLLASGEADSDAAIAVNALGLRHVLHAARENAIARVIYTGSVVAYGPPSFYDDRNVTEDCALRPQSAYGLSKALGEQVLQYHRDVNGMDACALRLALVYGPGRWYGGVLGNILEFRDAARALPPRIEVPSYSFDLVHVLDVARCVTTLLEYVGALPAAINMPGETTRFAQLANVVASLRGERLPLVEMPGAAPYPLMDGSLLARAFGFSYRWTTMTGLSEGHATPFVQHAE